MISIDSQSVSSDILDFYYSAFKAFRKDVSFKVTEETELCIRKMMEEYARIEAQVETKKLEEFLARREVSLTDWLILRFHRVIKGKG
jgi:hypothetical protein